MGKTKKAKQIDKLICPCCSKLRPIVDTNLLQAEAYWIANGAPPEWLVSAARSGRLQWACRHCIKAGRALAGNPAVQTWRYHDPYLAFFDVELRCEDCKEQFLFTASEQRFWYETLKFWVQSRPKQCIPCRQARRAARQEQIARSGEEKMI
jgi:Probable zinc-ribbon domain